MSDTTYVDYTIPTVNAEWLNEINDHVWHDTPIAGTTVHAGSVITNTPAGNISATTVQAAINELDTEKEPADATILKDADIGVTVQAYDSDIATIAASQAEMEAGTEPALRSMSPLRVRQAGAVNNFTEDTTPDLDNDFALVWDASASDNKKVKLNKIGTRLTLGTAVASTSGTSIDFTGIPAGKKRITIMFDGVSTNGTSNCCVQLGDSGGIETSGYLGAISNQGGSTTTNFSSSFVVTVGMLAADIYHGQIVLTNLNGNTWVESSILSQSGAAAVRYGSGVKTLSATLDRVRITTAAGADTFDAGTINIAYE